MLDHAAESARFDPNGHYVRRWLPVLARLPAKWIHRCATRAPASNYRQCAATLARLPKKHVASATVQVQTYLFCDVNCFTITCCKGNSGGGFGLMLHSGAPPPDVGMKLGQ